MSTLDQVTIRGYKTIRELRSFRLDRINVLIGGNGSGKSNFLGFFHLLSNLANETLRVHVKKSGGPDALLSGGSKSTSQMSAHLAFKGGVDQYRFSLVAASQDLVFGEEWFSPTKPAPLDDIPPTKFPIVGQGTYLPGGGFESRLPGGYRLGFLDGMKSWRKYHFQDMGRLAGPREPVPVRDDRVLKPDGSNIAPYLLRLSRKYPEAYRRIVQDVCVAVSHFGEFQVTVQVPPFPAA